MKSKIKISIFMILVLFASMMIFVGCTDDTGGSTIADDLFLEALKAAAPRIHRDLFKGNLVFGKPDL